MKVVKFGGSSLADAASFANARDIVLAEKDRQVVVVSAPGKRFSGDNKVTDLLYIIHAHLKYKVSFDDIWENIASRYREIARGLGLKLDVEALLAEVRAGFVPGATAEEIVSRGEYINARLMADCLGADFVDATQWLFFDFNGRVNAGKTYAALRELGREHPRMVLPGFYGALPDGRIHTFSRGGSDVTGALAAAALSAECYENWTDVSGILMADPKIVANPRPIERITFSELREMSYMGAEVLHEETVFPVRQADIPLYIKNTKDPSAPGTLIREEFGEDSVEEKNRFITGITGKQNYTIITISKARMREDIGFVRRVLEITEHYRLPVEHLPSSIDSFCLVIATRNLEGCLHELLTEIDERCEPDRITVCDGVSLVAVVGRRMARSTGVSGRIFETLGRCGINIRMIEQGSDEINIIIGVMNEDFTQTIRTLYESFT
ncbi:MAG: aspartate kinase [Lachnospiraceae bacterium]|nr:aspartate kinase [Lachnospiraceae bacterium]